MRFETRNEKKQYDLRDLGVLDGPPLRGASTIVNSLDVILGVPRAALLVIDDESSVVSVRASSSVLRSNRSYSAYGSVACQVRSENATQAIEDVRCYYPHAQEPDHLGAAAMLAAPVYGPDPEAIGCLVAIKTNTHRWSAPEIETLEDFAHLVTQEIILRASFQTLKILSTERNFLSI